MNKLYSLKHKVINDINRIFNKVRATVQKLLDRMPM